MPSGAVTFVGVVLAYAGVIWWAGMVKELKAATLAEDSFRVRGSLTDVTRNGVAFSGRWAKLRFDMAGEFNAAHTLDTATSCAVGGPPECVPAQGNSRVVKTKASYGRSCKSRKACVAEPEIVLTITYKLTSDGAHTKVRRIVDGVDVKQRQWLLPWLWYVALPRRLEQELALAKKSFAA